VWQAEIVQEVFRAQFSYAEHDMQCVMPFSVRHENTPIQTCPASPWRQRARCILADAVRSLCMTCIHNRFYLRLSVGVLMGVIQHFSPSCSARSEHVPHVWPLKSNLSGVRPMPLIGVAVPNWLLYVTTSLFVCPHALTYQSKTLQEQQSLALSCTANRLAMDYY
jgi:hypothetical protein